MKIGDKVKIIRILHPDDLFDFGHPYPKVGDIGTIISIAPETCAGLPCCPYDVKFDDIVIYMSKEELEVINE